MNSTELFQHQLRKGREGEDAFRIMANNHFEGFGPATANTLGKNLGMRELIWEEKKQKTLGKF